MVTKNVKYEDYNGNPREERCYFYLNTAELNEIDDELPGGLQGMMHNLEDTSNVKGFIKVVKDLVKRSYGIKSADGRTFRKSPELLADFVQSEAYSVVLEDVFSSVENMLTFIRGILPTSRLSANDKAKFDSEMDKIIEDSRAVDAELKG